MSEHEEQETPYEGGTELAVTRPVSRTVDMRSQATDSWTDVVADVSRLAGMIATTEFVPKGLRGSPAKVSAAILYSRELGLSPMTGLGGVHVIEGSAGISAELMRALILQAGHELVVKESSRERCEMWGRRAGQEEWTKAVWTIQEAGQTQVFISKEKGWQPLSSKGTWRSWPTELLLARTTTRLARMIFPDVIHGMRSVEELQDMTTTSEVDVPEAPEAPVVRRKQTTARKPQPAAPAPQGGQEAPARRRVARPAPRQAEAVQEQPQPSEPVKNHATEDAPKVTTIDPDPVPDADGVVDAEIVHEEPTTAPLSGAESARARKGATTAAIMHFDRLGVTDRAERIWYTSVIAGRELTSTNDLDLGELRKVVHVLERAKDIEAVNALVKDE